MMLWVCREADMPSGAIDELPRVPFQNLEDEFASWDNVVAFINQNVGGLH